MLVEVSLSFRNKILIWLFVLFVATSAAYLPAINNDFTNWDDPTYVTANPLIQSLSLKNMRDCFTGFVMGNYHPLTTLSLALDYRIGGLNPRQYHLTNLILHLLNTGLVFFLIFLLFNRNLNIVVVVSLLFGLHTIHVESVAWVTERKDVLYALFYLLSLIFYVQYLAGRRFLFFCLSLACFTLSLLSKGQAVTLAAVLFLIDYHWNGSSLSRRRVCKKIPFVVIAIFFGVVSLMGSRSSGAISVTNQNNFFEQVAFACFGLWGYFIKLLLPLNLSAFYPYPDRVNGHIPWLFWCSLWVLPALAATLVLTRKRAPQIFFGLVFFLINIALMLQIFPVGNVIMADRFAYIPSIGFFIVAASGLETLALRGLRHRYVSRVLFVAYLLMLAVLTFHRCDIWKDSLTLWDDTINKHPNSFFVFNLRGLAKAIEKDFRGAIKDYDRAIELNPGVLETYYNRGNARLKAGDDAGAISDFETVLKLKPDYSDAAVNMAYVLMRQRRYNEAIKTYNSLEKNTGLTAALYLSRGLAKINNADFDGAIEDYNRALTSDRHNPEIYLNRCYAFLKTANFAAAVKDCDEVIKTSPDYTEAFFYRGSALLGRHEYERAVSDYTRVIFLLPDYEGVYFNRGMALIRQGKHEEGCRDLDLADRRGFAWAKEALIDYCDR
ncbi:MAG: tetratricopeptide repeat protein [Deltaproteobacteria bacterium]|nr:tetratricopeptide repeat protein [Deltaproteobacteria bacterium]